MPDKGEKNKAQKIRDSLPSERLVYAPAVQQALEEGRAVVALESTIIAHGMPYPQNLETARKVEAAVAEEGAVPATIAILQGRIHLGLEPEQLHYLATAPQVEKASRRDIPLLLARRQDAATTVAATMIAAALGGIAVFATGGIGGVHRGAAQSFDISADLQELARTNVAVVSAGAKAILDLALTLEYLETLGVPVIGYQTDEFPAFYSRESGLPVPARMDTPRDIACCLAAKWQLGLQGGVLIANPIPQAHSIPPKQIEAAIEKALEEAQAANVRGKALTPFLLGRIARLTQNHSLFSNIELVLNNARLAARIARAFANLPESTTAR
ncbi:MAG: pseudouridine-5'-phosphate glycosidase [Bacteroidetes bacterium]|nr:MAG: pseudouridine-5'-phosphate glycosidase [Bacteroidota bacterium]